MAIAPECPSLQAKPSSLLRPFHLGLGITYKTKPGIFDEKRGSAALLIKNSGFCFIFNLWQKYKDWRREALQCPSPPVLVFLLCPL